MILAVRPSDERAIPFARWLRLAGDSVDRWLWQMSFFGVSVRRGAHGMTTVRDDRRPTEDPYREGMPPCHGEAMARPPGRHVPAGGVAAFHYAASRRGPGRPVNEIGRRAGGGVVWLSLVLFHPYLVTSPEHVQHALRDPADIDPHEGIMWKPMRRLPSAGSDRVAVKAALSQLADSGDMFIPTVRVA